VAKNAKKYQPPITGDANSSSIAKFDTGGN